MIEKDIDGIKRILTKSQIVFEEESEGLNTTISVHAGYDGFVSIFVFNKDGVLLSLGAWE